MSLIYFERHAFCEDCEGLQSILLVILCTVQLSGTVFSIFWGIPELPFQNLFPSQNGSDKQANICQQPELSKICPLPESFKPLNSKSFLAST